MGCAQFTKQVEVLLWIDFARTICISHGQSSTLAIVEIRFYRIACACFSARIYWSIDGMHRWIHIRISSAAVYQSSNRAVNPFRRTSAKYAMWNLIYLIRIQSITGLWMPQCTHSQSVANEDIYLEKKNPYMEHSLHPLPNKIQSASLCGAYYASGALWHVLLHDGRELAKSNLRRFIRVRCADCMRYACKSFWNFDGRMIPHTHTHIRSDRHCIFALQPGKLLTAMQVSNRTYASMSCEFGARARARLRRT